jgi:hypothetical protein
LNLGKSCPHHPQLLLALNSPLSPIYHFLWADMLSNYLSALSSTSTVLDSVDTGDTVEPRGKVLNFLDLRCTSLMDKYVTCI